MYTGSQSLDISTPGIITLEALVTITPMAENATIVVGSPNVYPSICSLWLFPNLVKSGTLRLRVAQNPIMAVNEGINTTQNSPIEWNYESFEKIGPKPPALTTTYINRAKAITRTIGAAQSSNLRTVSIPLYIIRMCKNQNIKKVIIDGIESPTIVNPLAIYPNAGHNVSMNVLIASPPINVWMPNHPQATTALRIAGMLAPCIPNEDLANTGNGMPYLVPG